MSIVEDESLKEAKKSRHSTMDDPVLPVEPFQIWLQSKCQRYGISGVSSAIGVSDRRVTQILSGKYHSSKTGKVYTVKNVKLSTVDRFMIAFEEYYWEIYGEIDP